MFSKQVSRKFFHSVNQLVESRLGRRCHHLFLSFSRTSIGLYCIRMTSLLTGLTFYLSRRVRGLWLRVAGSGRAMSLSGENKHDDDETDNTLSDDNTTKSAIRLANDYNIRAASTSPETEAGRYRHRASPKVSEKSQDISSDVVSTTRKESTSPVSSDDSSVVLDTQQLSAPSYAEPKMTLDREPVASREVQSQQGSRFNLWCNHTKDHKTREQVARDERDRYLSMPLSAKRKLYACGDQYVTLDKVPTWHECLKNERLKRRYPKENEIALVARSPFKPCAEINERVSIWRGDITTLEIDAIVNAANCSLLGGGGVDGAIHRAAGSALLAECRTLKGCETGEAKTTGGYKLPAKYIVHTVGPQGDYSHALRSCYLNCFKEMDKLDLKTIAFPCISTGIYGFPNEKAVHVALKATRHWLDKLASQQKLSQVSRVIFCLFLDVDTRLYESWMQVYFPNPSSVKKSEPSDEEHRSTVVADASAHSSTPKTRHEGTESPSKSPKDFDGEKTAVKECSRMSLDVEVGDIKSSVLSTSATSTGSPRNDKAQCEKNDAFASVDELMDQSSVDSQELLVDVSFDPAEHPSIDSSGSAVNSSVIVKRASPEPVEPHVDDVSCDPFEPSSIDSVSNKPTGQRVCESQSSYINDENLGQVVNCESVGESATIDADSCADNSCGKRVIADTSDAADAAASADYELNLHKRLKNCDDSSCDEPLVDADKLGNMFQ